MKKSISFIIFILIAMATLPKTSPACTVFCIDKQGELVIGRSYDWQYGEGIVLINKRNQTKTAFRYWDESSQGLATWTSKYGSVTFNQYGQDNTFGGMNETGLVVHEQWLSESVYPAADLRPSVSLDQYVQYILDNFSTVDEIAASDSLIRIRALPGNTTTIHFFAVDGRGEAIVIDFLNGEMVCHSRETLPEKAMTNNTYENSIAYMNRGEPYHPTSLSSLERFYRAAALASNVSGDAIDYSFQILDSVKQGEWTRFQCVFDINHRVIYWKSQQNPQLRSLNLNLFDFDCSTETTYLDINAGVSGDVTDQFEAFSIAVNENLIIDAWANLGYVNVYAPAIQIISRYPQTFQCANETFVDDVNGLLPVSLSLDQNYPNPFNPMTTISYQIENPMIVSLKIYNSAGQIVETLVDEFHSEGNYKAVWNASGCASGLYVCRLEAGGEVKTSRMILVR